MGSVLSSLALGMNGRSVVSERDSSAGCGCLVILLLAVVTVVMIHPLLAEDSKPPSGRPRQPPTSVKPPSVRSTAVKGFDDYSVRVGEYEGITNCQVFFNSLPLTSDIAAEVVRNAVENLVKQDGNHDILGMAFDASGRTLTELQYGGAISYKPSDRQILTMDERDGLQAKESDEGPYSVRVEDGKTITSITPERRWHYVYIVFADEPSAREVDVAVAKEIEKLKRRGLDITAFVYVGDKSNKMTWKQIEVPNGNFMCVEYSAATGEVEYNWEWSAEQTSLVWHHKDGSVIGKGTIHSTRGQYIILRLDDGTTKPVRLDWFCPADREYIRALQ